MYSSLKEYIELLEREGELLRVSVDVDPVLEIAEIADRMAKSAGGGKALLFENTGTEFPVLVNMFGSDRRMALSLGVDSLEDIPGRIDAFVQAAMSPKGSLSEKISVLPLLGKASRWFPKCGSGRGKCQDIILQGNAVRLGVLPVLKCWPHDGGRFVTLPMVNTIDPDTGARNVGMYRMQLFDESTTGMHWHIHKTGARHYEAYKRLGKRMPVSVCLGGDPAYTYSATAPLPDGIDEYLLAGFMRGKPVRLVKCITNDIYVPSDCDFVIEGYVDPAEEKVIEGPFGDHTGFYSLEDMYPKFHVTAITHRKDAVYAATIVGVPPQEDVYVSRATEKIFLAPIRLVMQPEIEDLYMPAAGVSHNLALISMQPRYAGQVHKVTSSMWGAGQMMFNKYMVVAPSGTRMREAGVIAGLLRGADLDKSVIRGAGVLDVLDHTTATPGFGGKLAIDLTGASVAPQIKVPDNIVTAGGISHWDSSLLAEWGAMLLFADPVAEVNMAAFIAANPCGAKIVVLFDCPAASLTAPELLWLAAGNTDPSRDVTLVGGVLIADARTKLSEHSGNPPRFPNVVTSSAATIELVDARWNDYGIGAFIPSPSLRYSTLVMSDKAEI